MKPSDSRDPFAAFFRVARSGNRPLWNAVKTIAQSLVLWSIFFAAIPAMIYAIESRTPLAAFRWTNYTMICRTGTVLFFLMGVLTLATGVGLAIQGHGTPLPMDTAQRLVVWGAYGYIRNPLAFGSIIQGATVGVAYGSPAIVGYCFLGILFWNYCVRPVEETELERRFGEPYQRYRAAVRCWIPRLRPYRPGDK